LYLTPFLESETDSREEDVAVAVVVGRDAVPGEAADPAVGEVVAEGGAEHDERAAAARLATPPQPCALAKRSRFSAIAVSK